MCVLCGLRMIDRSVDLCGCTKISNVGVKTLATGCTRLEHLDLSSTPVNHRRCAAGSAPHLVFSETLTTNNQMKNDETKERV